MDNARLNKIKGRKLGEIVLYASMIALEPEERNEFVELIGEINRDVNDIDGLLSGSQSSEHDPIVNTRYIERLSTHELDDERYLNELRTGQTPVVEDIVEMVVDDDIVVSSVPEEIPSSDEVTGSEDDDVDEPYMQPLFTEDDENMLREIRAMKNSKVDLFIERELAGNFKEEACEDVIRFTKIDMRLIDLLLELDYSDRDRLESNLKTLVDIVNGMDAPKYGKLYVNSLNKEEAKLEVRYNEFIDKVDELVKERFPEIVPDALATE